ncbi:MAG: hypothetical protein PUP92_11960 [Rhizonema sp. PD38]|nr:hypothetical protein [Rhizonema sp. PD38]
MTEATIKKDPFDFLFYYDKSDLGEREEDALLIGDDPSTASSLHLDIGIKDAKQIVIRPISGATTASSSNYHFKLQFNPGILLEPQKITVEGDDWDLEVEGDTILYLLWKQQEFTLDDTSELELMLNGVMGTLARAVRTSQTKVTLSWEFKRGGITIINVTARAPGDSNPYNNSATEILEMIQRQGKANIPLYVGFFSSNRVLNINNHESNLKLRITNTSESAITFNYSSDATNRSQLVIALEVGNADTVPWALGTEDQVNNVVVTIPEDKWEKTAGPTPVKVGTTVRTLEWTFSPKSADVSLAAKDTLVVKLSKIVTDHPTGTANLYLRYQYVSSDYQDGEFICPIEKTPLVFFDQPPEKDKKEDKNVGIGTTVPAENLHIRGGNLRLDTIGAENGGGEIRSWGHLVFRSDVDNSGDDYVAKFFKQDKPKSDPPSDPLMVLDKNGNVGIGTISPQTKLHVTETVKAKNVEVVETVKAKKFEGDGVVVTKMILMWSGLAEDIPAGWVLCNGQKGTPDLRDKFIVGAGNKYLPKATGGCETITLSKDQMPSHNHEVTDPGHSHSIEMRDSSSDLQPTSLPLYARNNINDSNRKGTNRGYTGISIQYTGGNQPFDNRPPYYALCFIMKVAIS